MLPALTVGRRAIPPLARHRAAMRRLLIALSSLAMLSLVTAASAADMVGQASIIDGDMIVRMEPNALCAPIHNRMPVILGPAEYDRWLSAEAPPEDLLRPFPADQMAAYPVSTWVNTPAHNDARCVEPPA
jgi:putative SOS response-associated peptidase YedK